MDGLVTKMWSFSFCLLDRGFDPHNVHVFELWDECGVSRGLGTTCGWMHMQWSSVERYTDQIHSLTSNRSVLPCARQK